MKKIKRGKLPSVSVVLPVYNGEKYLPKCLGSLRGQDYPQKQVELIVVDDDSSDASVQVAKSFGAKILRNGERHIERGKAIGIRAAKHELILFLDADNYFPDPSWLINAVTALMKDKSLCGVESARFNYVATDPAANRYCSLFGINDPLAFYLRRRDRLADWENDWNLMGTVEEDRGTYWKIAFTPEEVPTLGSQGYLMRKSLIKKATHWPYFFHIDAHVELIKQGHTRFALLKQPIGHDHCASPAIFVKKCRRNLDLFFKYRHLRHYTWETPREEFIETVALMTTFLVPTVDALKGFVRRRDPAFFLHPLFSFIVPVLYALKTTQQFIGKFMEDMMAKARKSSKSRAASVSTSSSSSRKPKMPEAAPALPMEEPGFSPKSGVFLVVALLLGLFVFSKVACKKGAHVDSAPVTNAGAGLPSYASPQGVEDAAKNGDPDLKSKNMASLNTMALAIDKYHKEHNAYPKTLESVMPNMPSEAISGKKTSAAMPAAGGGWLYCAQDGQLGVNLPDLTEAANPACQGYYALNGNLHDGSGNGRNGYFVGSKISFEKGKSIPGKGAFSGAGFTDTNFVDLPPTVFSPAMGASGTIKQSVYMRPDSADSKVSLASNHGASGNFFLLWQANGTLTVRVPTSEGVSKDCVSAKNAYAKGRWYTVYVNYDAKGVRVQLKDESKGTSAMVIKESGVTPSFGAASRVRIGGDTVYTTFGWDGMVASTGYYESQVGPGNDSGSVFSCK